MINFYINGLIFAYGFYLIATNLPDIREIPNGEREPRSSDEETNPDKTAAVTRQFVSFQNWEISWTLGN